MAVFGQSGCSRSIVVVLRQKLLYSGKNSSIRAKRLYSVKVVVFGQKLFNFGKVVVLGQNLLYSGRNGCIRAEWLYSGKSCCIRVKVVVIVQN